MARLKEKRLGVENFQMFKRLSSKQSVYSKQFTNNFDYYNISNIPRKEIYNNQSRILSPVEIKSNFIWNSNEKNIKSSLNPDNSLKSNNLILPNILKFSWNNKLDEFRIIYNKPIDISLLSNDENKNSSLIKSSKKSKGYKKKKSKYWLFE